MRTRSLLSSRSTLARADGHHHHPSAAHAPDFPEGLVAMIGGGATAAGEASAVTGSVENFAEDRG